MPNRRTRTPPPAPLPQGPVEGPNREPLLQILRTMPWEAFGWFVAWATVQTAANQLPHQFRFPDGLGGFKPASREAIEALRAEAQLYIDQMQ